MSFSDILNFVFLFIFLGILSCGKENNIPKISKTSEPVFYAPDEFIMGADLSYSNTILEKGGIFKLANKVEDPFKIFKTNGANLIRIRLWHSPETWQKDLNNGHISGNLTDVTKSILKAKSIGLQVLLDLHYSDVWADPDKQVTPEKWKNLSFEVLKDSVYQYTSTILNHLANQNLIPEYIQIGNECNQGLLFPYGKIENNDFQNFAELLKSGITAVRDFSKTQTIKTKVILHIAQFQYADWWVNGLVNQENLKDFDIIGVSHYFPYASLTSMTDLTTEIAKLKAKYNKEVMVVETAYPWTSDNSDSYGNIFSGKEQFTNYKISKTGQYEYLKDLTAAIMAGGGKGIIYWAPDWISSNMRDLWGTGSSWENNALFDFNGNILPAVEFMTHDYGIQN